MVRIMFILQSVGEPARLAEPVGMTRLTIIFPLPKEHRTVVYINDLWLESCLYCKV